MKVAIFGSCVSRDVFNVGHGNGMEVTCYYARSSMASAFSQPGWRDNYSAGIQSAFQRRMVSADISKEFSRTLESLAFDILVIDFIDERFSLCQDPQGSIITLSNELQSTGFRVDREGGRLIPSGSDEFLLYWKQGWQLFINIMKRADKMKRVVLNKVYWAYESLSKKNFLPQYGEPEIRAANRFLHTLYQHAAHDIPDRQILSYPSELLLASDDHRWGKSPFHFVEGYYEEALRLIQSRTEVLQSMDVTCSAREHPVEESEDMREDPANVAAMPHLQGTSEAAEAAATGRKSCERENLLLSGRPCLHYLDVGQEDVIDIVVELVAGSSIQHNAALIQFRFEGADSFNPRDYGLSVSTSAEIGLYRYLSTEPGLAKTSFTLRIPPGTRCIAAGIRKWQAGGAWVILSYFSARIRRANAPKVLVSVDVEALPGRATDKHVDLLIFGKTDGGHYGIERLCAMFREFDIRATFFVDYATCILHGDEAIFRAAGMLMDQGHDVQLHMHSEVLVRKLLLPHDPHTIPGFDVLGADVIRQVLEYGIEKYYKNLHRLPAIFRPGGMKKSRAMYDACRRLGIQAVSAIYKGYDAAHWEATKTCGIYRWENGVTEIPLDIAVDPLNEWPRFSSEMHLALNNKKQFSMLLHSTSLLHRELNGNSVFTRYEPKYELTLRRYLRSAKDAGEFATHAELLGTRPAAVTVPFSGMA